MKVTEIRTTPLLVPYTEPYYWAQGVIEGAAVILVEVDTDAGVTGYGECIATPSAAAVEGFVQEAAAGCLGHSPLDSARLMATAYHALFQAHGTCSAPRFAGQVLAGIEMALWDAAGKALGCPVHRLLGGAVHEHIRYFGFPQGRTAGQVAADAGALAAQGYEVIYVKVGRGDALDLETVAAVRAAIGPDRRLRIDPNEHWSPVHAMRMMRRLAPFDIEFVEQPVHSESIGALAQLRAMSPIPLAADQAVFTPFEAFDVCRERAADLIVLGVHETGGLLRFCKVAHIAEAAGIDICIHGLYETGITTCASNQVAATVPNLDDGNQHMTRFLAWDIVSAPDLTPRDGRLPVLAGPGLGFELDRDAVERARALHAANVTRHR